MKIGFIGQGWIGKNYADNFEDRGYDIVRYGIEKEYVDNKEKISDCDIVFIAVPTPTTPDGFDYSIVESVLPLVGEGKVAVIKSTILPGTTEMLQKKFPKIHVFHSPEFLEEARARYNTDFPDRNIVGIPVDNDENRKLAQQVMDVLPDAPYNLICPVKDAELIKYSGNVFLYFKVLFANLLYDLTQKLGADYDVVREAVSADPRIGNSHLRPVHASGHTDKPGRGAGGECFIKDYRAFKSLFDKYLADDKRALAILNALEAKNLELLVSTEKDLDLLTGVYGEEVIKNATK
jgi:UDPglucose 6-dehydrogenase